MVAWHSSYMQAHDQAHLAARLRDHLLSLGYVEFNPFGLMPGRVYADAVRAFVAPPRQRWVRVLMEKPFPLPPLPLVIETALEGDAVRVFIDGAHVEASAALAAYPCMAEALNAPADGQDAPHVGGVPFDALPADIQGMAAGIDARQVGKLFDKMSAGALGKLGGDAAGAADLLKGADWTSLNGTRIRRVMACLAIPDWRDPDFVTLRDAYALHERRRRNPNARLYPGDAETMHAVPNALDHLPLYVGKD